MNTREKLLQEIETTRLEFHNLLETIPEDAYNLPSDNPAWNIGQVLFHIAVIPRYMIVEVVMIQRQVRLYQLVPRLIPKGLFDWLNARMTDLAGRRMSRQRLKEIYEKSYRASLEALASVSDSDFEKHLNYPLWDPLLAGSVTLEYLFGYIKRHFDSHAAQVRKAALKG